MGIRTKSAIFPVRSAIRKYIFRLPAFQPRGSFPVINDMGHSPPPPLKISLQNILRDIDFREEAGHQGYNRAGGTPGQG